MARPCENVTRSWRTKTRFLLCRVEVLSTLQIVITYALPAPTSHQALAAIRNCASFAFTLFASLTGRTLSTAFTLPGSRNPCTRAVENQITPIKKVPGTIRGHQRGSVLFSLTLSAYSRTPTPWLYPCPTNPTSLDSTRPYLVEFYRFACKPFWWRWGDSNPRPTRFHFSLQGRSPHYHDHNTNRRDELPHSPLYLVEADGFEPPRFLQNGFTVRRLQPLGHASKIHISLHPALGFCGSHATSTSG